MISAGERRARSSAKSSGVQAFEELDAEVGGFGWGGLALDGVLDRAEDLFAGVDAAGLTGDRVGDRVGAEMLEQENGPADGERDAVVGDGAGGERGLVVSPRGGLALEGDGGADVDEDGEGALDGGVVELGEGDGVRHGT